eukprot:33116-Prymnesium_polylepis.2
MRERSSRSSASASFGLAMFCAYSTKIRSGREGSWYVKHFSMYSGPVAGVPELTRTWSAWGKLALIHWRSWAW